MTTTSTTSRRVGGLRETGRRELTEHCAVIQYRGRLLHIANARLVIDRSQSRRRERKSARGREFVSVLYNRSGVVWKTNVCGAEPRVYYRTRMCVFQLIRLPFPVQFMCSKRRRYILYERMRSNWNCEVVRTLRRSIKQRPTGARGRGLSDRRIGADRVKV